MTRPTPGCQWLIMGERMSRLAKILSYTFIKLLGLCTAQETEESSQSAALAQVSSGSYHPEIDDLGVEDVEGCLGDDHC